MPSEYQQDYEKTRAYAPKIYNDPNMSDALRDIYRTLEIRYVHEGRTIDTSFYNDLSDDSVAKFTAIGFDCFLALDDEICPRLRIEQYFHVQDYALWDVIKNGNSFKPAAQTITNAEGTSTTQIPGLYKDAKTLFAAIQTRFGGNEATKKTQKTLLKQMYENFSAPSTESLDSIFNMLQKILSQLAILGENISQEDLNSKFLRSLPSEWNTHVVVWRNKPDLDTMSFDDLYNNFKIVEQEVKGTPSSSSSSQIWLLCHLLAVLMRLILLMKLVLLTLKSVLLALKLALLDLEQIYEDNLEEMDLKWQLALLSMRTRRFYQKTGRKITINRSDTAGYDKSKVECFNCQKLGNFARECRGPRNQESRDWNQDSSRRTVNVEETSSKAMLAIDEADSEVHNDKTCLKTYLKSFETLKTQLDDLRIEFNKSEFNLATYKRGLASVEEQLVFYKKNEVIFYEQIVVLKRDISYKDSKISVLKSGLEKLKQEKESNQLKIENFDNASKRLFLPPNPDLSNSGLEEFQQPEFEAYGPKTSKNVSEDTSNEVGESHDALLVEELVLDDTLEKTVFPTVAKIDFVRPKQQEKPVRKLVKYAKMYRAHPSGHRNMAPRAVLMKTGLRPLNTPRPINTAQHKTIVHSARPMSHFSKSAQSTGHLQKEDQGYVDSGRSRHMTGNISYLSDFKEFDGGYITFGGGAKGGRITGKADESQVLLKVPRKNNMYSVDMKNIVPKKCLTCLVAKATLDESMLWHRRLGHVNFKTINKLVKENLVRGLPIKRFENDQTRVACLKGKQHKASSSKDETSGILKSFITEIENLVDKKVKIIRCDNGTEFKNIVMSEFCKKKGIKREFSIARTPQQNDVAERRNRTLIEAARTMLADSKLPTTFWAKVVNTACYVQNRVLVVKPHNKTPYELLRGRTPSLSSMRPFGCHVTILNTLDYLGMFDGKSDEGFFVGYSINSKAFRVYNIRTRKLEENLHIRFLEDKPIIAGDGPKWLFDIDVLTKSMNYVPVVAGTNSNDFVRIEESIGAGHSNKETGSSQDYIVMPHDPEKKDDEGVSKKSGIDDQEKPKDSAQDVNTAGPSINTASTNFNTGSLNINTVSPTVTTAPLEATHADFFGDETKLDMSNITTTYSVLSIPNTSDVRSS
ncbi:putative ribonuclease H-like domain-containing protein [Tanacetum coccineum]